jgi:cyclomaltodextrinase
MKQLIYTNLLLILLALLACNEQQAPTSQKDVKDTKADPYQPRPYVEIEHPEWSKNATIYEVNIRQFSEAGNFEGFKAHLPRLKEMGIDILWLMPIHPIGEKNRKGGMGSYYSVKDYKAVNPEFGTMDEFKALVDTIHSMGMYVILDWVANHSAWDNELVEDHPEWYTRTREGNYQPTPWYDWSDIIDFDYSQPGIRKYMTGALKYWVEETDIDGYRCDVAGFMPIDFWENARAELDAIKPVFMLAEWESRDLHRRAFDMTYAWSLWGKMHAVTTGGKPIGTLNEFMAHHVNTFPENGYRMTFTDNHDKNSWEGTQFSNFGDGLVASMVFASTVSGMPLVYSGQEAGLDRSLAFFEKDLIEWKEHRFADIYKSLFDLKHQNKALWNGKYGGTMIKVENDQPDQVITFYREKDGDKVLVAVNFSDQPVSVTMDTRYIAGTYRNLFANVEVEIGEAQTIALAAWGYMVLH